MKKFITALLSFCIILFSSSLLKAEGELAVPADSVTVLPGISEGVSLSPSSITWSANLAGPLNGVTYGPAAYGGYPGGASGWVHSTYTIPSDGNYSLFFLVSDIYDEIFDSALAIDNVTVTSLSSEGDIQTVLEASFEDGIPDGWIIGGHADTSTSVEGISPVDGNQFAFIDTVGELESSYDEEGYYYEPSYFSAEIFGYIESGEISADIYLPNEDYESESYSSDIIGSLSGSISDYSAYGYLFIDIDGLYTTGSWSVESSQGNTTSYSGTFETSPEEEFSSFLFSGDIYLDVSSGEENSSSISGYLEGTVYPDTSDLEDSSGVVNTSAWGGTSGTYLQSPTFWAEAGSTVSFYANFLTNDGDGYPDFAMVQLLQNLDGETEVAATLYTADASSAFVHGLSPEYPLLPEIVEGPGPFEFSSIEVNPGVPYYFDPAIAIGYEYYVSDNAFESVLLPDETTLFAGADNLYDLWLFNYSNNTWFDTGIDITGGTQFYFTQLDLDGDGSFDFPNGITLFRILGIDPQAGLDPADPNAFVTGLTFVNAGTATVTQTPLATPEPSSILLLSAGLLIAGGIMRKAKKS